MRAVRVVIYIILIILLALLGNLIWLIGGNVIALLLLGIILVALPSRGEPVTGRRLLLLGAIGVAVTLVSAVIMLVLVLIWSGPTSMGNVAAGPFLWVGSTFTFVSYMVALGVERWAIWATTRPLQH